MSNLSIIELCRNLHNIQALLDLRDAISVKRGAFCESSILIQKKAHFTQPLLVLLQKRLVRLLYPPLSKLSHKRVNTSFSMHVKLDEIQQRLKCGVTLLPKSPPFAVEVEQHRKTVHEEGDLRSMCCSNLENQSPRSSGSLVL